MKFTGICPKTNKVETIYCMTINCPTQDNPYNYIPGTMYACSTINTKEDLCEDCPINNTKNKGD